MKLKSVVQGCSLRKTRSKSPIDSVDSDDEYHQTVLKDYTNSRQSDLTPKRRGYESYNLERNRPDKEFADLNDKDSKGNIPSMSAQLNENGIMQLLPTKEESDTEEESMTQPEEILKVNDLSHENKYLRQENNVLRIDVQNMEERVEQLQRVLEECKKTKADTVIEEEPYFNENGQLMKVRDDNVGMSETMKVMAKLVQRQEKSLKRHRQQSTKHQKEMKKFRQIIGQLERNLYLNQQKLFEVQTQDLSHKKRVESLRRQIAYMENQLQSYQRANFENKIGQKSLERDLNVSKQLLEALKLPSSQEDPPTLDASVDSSCSEESTPPAAEAKTDFGGRRNKPYTKEELLARKQILELEREYLLSKKKEMDKGIQNQSVSDISEVSISSEFYSF